MMISNNLILHLMRSLFVVLPITSGLNINQPKTEKTGMSIRVLFKGQYSSFSKQNVTFTAICDYENKGKDVAMVEAGHDIREKVQEERLTSWFGTFATDTKILIGVQTRDRDSSAEWSCCSWMSIVETNNKKLLGYEMNHARIQSRLKGAASDVLTPESACKCSGWPYDHGDNRDYQVWIDTVYPSLGSGCTVGKQLLDPLPTSNLVNTNIASLPMAVRPLKYNAIKSASDGSKLRIRYRGIPCNTESEFKIECDFKLEDEDMTEDKELLTIEERYGDDPDLKVYLDFGTASSSNDVLLQALKGRVQKDMTLVKKNSLFKSTLNINTTGILNHPTTYGCAIEDHDRTCVHLKTIEVSLKKCRRWLIQLPGGGGYWEECYV